jgi:hypothetical protein
MCQRYLPGLRRGRRGLTRIDLIDIAILLRLLRLFLLGHYPRGVHPHQFSESTPLFPRYSFIGILRRRQANHWREARGHHTQHHVSASIW